MSRAAIRLSEAFADDFRSTTLSCPEFLHVLRYVRRDQGVIKSTMHSEELPHLSISCTQIALPEKSVCVNFAEDKNKKIKVPMSLFVHLNSSNDQCNCEHQFDRIDVSIIETSCHELEDIFG